MSSTSCVSSDRPGYAYELRSVIVNDFYEAPDEVRRFALAAKFYKTRDATIWQTRTQLFEPNVEFRLEQCWGGRAISTRRWKDDTNNGTFFLACARGRYRASPFVHFDVPPTYVTVIVFLTPGHKDGFGTTFYRHRPYRLVRRPRRSHVAPAERDG